MRKICGFIIIGTMLFTLTACGSDTTALQQQVSDLQERVAVLEYQLAELEEAKTEVQETESTEAESTEAESELPEEAECDMTADFTEDQKTVFDTVNDFKDSPAYIKIAKDYNTIKVLHAVRLLTKVEDEQIELMLIDCDADKDIYGVDAGILAVDISDGTVHDMNSLDINNYSGQMETHQDRIAMCFGSYTAVRMGSNQSINSDMDITFELSAEELEQVNQALNQ